MLKPTEKQRVVSVTTTVITTIGLLLGSIGSTLAQPPRRMLAAPTSQPTSATLSVLEDALWVCDYLATTRGSSDIATFTAVYESLKDRKFADDFDAWCPGCVRTKSRNIKSWLLRIAQAISKLESTLKGEPS